MSTKQDVHKWLIGFQTFLNRRPEFAPFAKEVTVRPRELRDFDLIVGKHKKTWIKALAAEAFQDMILQALNAYTLEDRKVPDPSPDPSDEILAAVAELKKSGTLYLPPIAPETVSAMRNYLAERPIYPSSRAEKGTEISIAEARQSVNVAVFSEPDMINCPGLLETALDPLRLGVARHFLGVPPTIALATGWWSFADPNEPKAAQLFHIDVDDYKFVKFFIYLTDVDETSGPHAFVPTTHRHDVILDASNRAVDNDDFGRWYIEKLRKTDEEVQHFFGIEPIHITGPAGTNFMASTNGIHKGTLPKSKDRLICQVVYGVSPLKQTPYEPVTFGTTESSNLPENMQELPLSYSVRLLASATP